MVPVSNIIVHHIILHPHCINNVSQHLPFRSSCHTFLRSYQPNNQSSFTPQVVTKIIFHKSSRKVHPLPNFQESKNGIFKQLNENKLMAHCHARPMLPSYLQYYSPNSSCENHPNIIDPLNKRLLRRCVEVIRWKSY